MPPIIQDTYRKIYFRKQGEKEINFLLDHKHPAFVKLLYYDPGYKWAVFERGEFTFASHKLEIWYTLPEIIKWLNFAQAALKEFGLYHNDIYEKNIICFPRRCFPKNFALIDFEGISAEPTEGSDYSSFNTLKEQARLRCANRKPVG